MGKLAERIWLQNRAQALNLSLSTIGAALGAAKMAHKVGQGIARHIGQGVSDAVGFDELLKAPDAANVGSSSPDSIGSDSIGTEASAQSLSEAILHRLTALGIDVNQELAIEVSNDGQIQVLGEHLQAAEIESILNADQQIRQIAKQLAGTDTANGLTIRTNQENIRSSPGGYPNW